MDIGTKLREARAAAGLTQERAAETLGVSRQTVSNWENGRTYPDIANVVAMSDLYDVSLDRLLKGEPSGAGERPASGYVGYLVESTDAVAGANRLSHRVTAGVYLGIWALELAVFWLFPGGDDALGYSIATFLVVLPLTTFVVSLLVGGDRSWGAGRWALPLALGAMYMLAEYATFGAANMATVGRPIPPSLEMVPIGAAVSLVGMGLGAGVARLGSGRRRAVDGGRPAARGRVFAAVCVACTALMVLVAGLRWCSMLLPSYAATLDANWGVELPSGARFYELYTNDGDASFHGDGVRYRVLSYEDGDAVAAMLDWSGPAASFPDVRDVEAWLDALEVPPAFRPDYDACSWWRAAQDDGSELAAFWDADEGRVYIAESFM